MLNKKSIVSIFILFLGIVLFSVSYSSKSVLFHDSPKRTSMEITLEKPDKIIVFNYGTEIEIEKNDKSYSKIIDLVENAFQKSDFGMIAGLGIIDGQLTEYRQKIGIELIYKELTNITSINQEVYRLFIDLNQQNMFKSHEDTGLYRSGAYHLDYDPELKEFVRNSLQK